MLNLSKMIANTDLAGWIVTGEGMPVMQLEEFREQRIEGDYRIDDKQKRKICDADCIIKRMKHVPGTITDLRQQSSSDSALLMVGRKRCSAHRQIMHLPRDSHQRRFQIDGIRREITNQRESIVQKHDEQMRR